MLQYIRKEMLGMENKEKKIFLATCTMHEEEMIYVNEAFETNWVTSAGKNIDEFENSIKQLLDIENAVATGSGTSALHLAMKLANVKQDDIVFAQSLTFDATVNPAMYEKAKLVFIDSEEETWNMDPKALEKAFEKYPNCKVVIVVNLYGIPAKLDEIREICNKHKAVLIEDAAESLGATYKGKMTGTFGDYSALSFNGNKIVTTSGGGMLLTSDKEAGEKARKLSTQAKDVAPWYQHTEIGYNYRLSNVLAGIGRGQLLHLQEHIDIKRAIYERYVNGLKDLPVKLNPYLDYSNPIFWLSCLLIDKEAMCKHNRTDSQYTYIHEDGKTCPDEIRDKLLEHNIETRPIWKPMHMQPIYRNNDYIYLDNDISRDIFDRGICLPSDIKMTVEEQEKVISIIKECFK